MASDPHDNIRKEREEEEEEEEGGNGGGIEIMELVDQDQEDQTGMQITAVAVEDSGVSTKGKINKYHECLKNHAASIGGHAIDGCCEFMPSGEEGTLEALKCAACNCHRNFHRRETEEDEPRTSTPGGFFSYRKNKGPFYSNPKFPFGLPTGSPAIPPLIMGCGGGGTTESSSEDLNNNTTTTTTNTTNNNDNSNPAMAVIPSKKRFRTKFTQDQKEKMLGFAEKLGWRIQKQDEAAIQQFCAEVGVKRHVLKVWMHNNKHTMKKPQ